MKQIETKDLSIIDPNLKIFNDWMKSSNSLIKNYLYALAFLWLFLTFIYVGLIFISCSVLNITFIVFSFFTYLIAISCLVCLYLILVERVRKRQRKVFYGLMSELCENDMLEDNMLSEDSADKGWLKNETYKF